MGHRFCEREKAAAGAAGWGERRGRRSMLGTLAAGAAAVWATAVSRVATARTAAGTRLGHSRVVPYPMAQVWPTALRYLRVDRGYTLVDRDGEAGYVLFDFPISDAGSGAAADAASPTRAEEEIRVGRGSLELLAMVDASGRPSVKVQVSTDAGPTHLPHAIAEGLAAKLKRERGHPAPPPPPPKAPPGAPAPDAPTAPDADDPDDGSLPTLPPAVDPSEL